LLSLSFSSHAQTQPANPPGYKAPETASKQTLPPLLVRDLVSLRDAALTDDYAYQQLAHLTENIGPRASGTPQAEAAVEYVGEELRKLGLEVKLEDVKVRHWERRVDMAELIDYPGQVPGATQKIIVTALGGNTPTSPAGMTGNVLVVNSF